MPVGRYFLYIGSVLLALLFIIDWYLPQPDAGAARSDVDRSTIRIHSARKWPKAVVFDTTVPTIVPPPATTAAAPAPPPPVPKAARDAYALAEATPEAKPVEAAKPAKPHARRPRVARAPAGHDASTDMFGFRNDTFGSRNGTFGYRNDFFGPRPMWSSRW